MSDGWSTGSNGAGMESQPHLLGEPPLRGHKRDAPAPDTRRPASPPPPHSRHSHDGGRGGTFIRNNSNTPCKYILGGEICKHFVCSFRHDITKEEFEAYRRKTGRDNRYGDHYPSEGGRHSWAGPGDGVNKRMRAVDDRPSHLYDTDTRLKQCVQIKNWWLIMQMAERLKM
jgi:hypothetical protein